MLIVAASSNHETPKKSTCTLTGGAPSSIFVAIVGSTRQLTNRTVSSISRRAPSAPPVYNKFHNVVLLHRQKKVNSDVSVSFRVSLP